MKHEATDTNPATAPTDPAPPEPVTADSLRAWHESITGVPQGYVASDAELEDNHKAWVRDDLQKPNRMGVVEFVPKKGSMAEKIARCRGNRGKLAVATRAMHAMTAQERDEATQAYLFEATTGSDEKDPEALFEIWLTKKLFAAAADQEVMLGELPWRNPSAELLAKVREIALA